MGSGLKVRAIEFFPAAPDLGSKGLIAWVSFSVSGIQFHDISLRRTAHGVLALSWPRTKGQGHLQRCAHHPINDEVRRALEEPVIAEAKRQGIVQ